MYHDVQQWWKPEYSESGIMENLFSELWTSSHATNFTQEDLAQEFAKGRITMMINQMSVTSILKSNQTNFTVGMAEVPYDKAGGTFWFGDEVCLTKEAGDGTLAFARYLTQQDISERINDAMGTLQVYSENSYKKNGKVYMEETSGLSAKARTVVYYRSWSDICRNVAEGVSEVLNSRMSIASQEKVAEATRDQVRVAIMSEP